jgi:hypothetical protein
VHLRAPAGKRELLDRRHPGPDGAINGAIYALMRLAGVLVLVAANPCLNQEQLGSAPDLSAPNLAVILDRLAERDALRSLSDAERALLIEMLPKVAAARVQAP